MRVDVKNIKQLLFNNHIHFFEYIKYLEKYAKGREKCQHLVTDEVDWHLKLEYNSTIEIPSVGMSN